MGIAIGDENSHCKRLKAQGIRNYRFDDKEGLQTKDLFRHAILAALSRPTVLILVMLACDVKSALRHSQVKKGKVTRPSMCLCRNLGVACRK